MAAKKASGVVQQMEDEVDKIEEGIESIVLNISTKLSGQFCRAGEVLQGLEKKLVQELVGKGYADRCELVPDDEEPELAADGKDFAARRRECREGFRRRRRRLPRPRRSASVPTCRGPGCESGRGFSLPGSVMRRSNRSGRGRCRSEKATAIWVVARC